jgi:hypothetical protein
MAEIGRRKRDPALLLALASGQTVRDAARSAGIGERTATRRVADPDFRRWVAELRAEMIGRALGQLPDGITEAAGTLRKLLAADGDGPVDSGTGEKAAGSRRTGPSMQKRRESRPESA